ncbi:hypothetical protein DXA14_15605 [Hungatella hathewayi]|nr:hypothetical protein DXA14_15605 [Hungatella hathewayi]
MDRGRKPENQGKLQRVRKQIPAHDGGSGRSLYASGAGENHLRRAVAFGVYLHKRLLYPGDDGGKILCLAGTVHSKERKKQYCYYRLAGAVMVAASLLYVVYSLWTIRHPKTVNYGKITAITIAAITFTEIGVNVWGVIKYRKYHSPLLHALKMISLGTSLISLVLTQSAILAFADEAQDPSVNGFLGTVTGICAALLGVYMIRRINRIEAEDLHREDSY